MGSVVSGNHLLIVNASTYLGMYQKGGQTDVREFRNVRLYIIYVYL